MATQSNYKYNSPANRKAIVNWLEGQDNFWHKYTGNTWYDDGHDESDINEIVASLKMAVDQGTSTLLRDCIKSGSSPEDARHMKVPKWIPFEPKEPKVTKAVVRERYINMPDVNRTMPNVEKPKPYVPPKLHTIIEDCQMVEHLMVIIEAVDNLEIIRTFESVRIIANRIRNKEHSHYRYKQPISCEQVRDILKEFEK